MKRTFNDTSGKYLFEHGATSSGLQVDARKTHFKTLNNLSHSLSSHNFSHNVNAIGVGIGLHKSEKRNLFFVFAYCILFLLMLFVAASTTIITI